MPYRFVNLRSGKTRDSLNNPAEIGTALLEFGMLSKLTKNNLYYEKAKNALVQLYNRRSGIGLVGEEINVETGEWVSMTSHIGGGIDSYYEYLLKAWILFGDSDCKSMWDESIKSINRYLADSTRGELWYGQADMKTGRRTGTSFGSLEAFMPAVLCLSGDVENGARLEESSVKMWELYGIEPEAIDYSTMKVSAKQYYLRPEIIESAYYLHHYTDDPRYLKLGETFFHAIVKYCRTEAGFAYLTDVTTKAQGDAMPSFFLTETLKYLYLLFSSDNVMPFDDVVFTTEAHPFMKSSIQRH
jgi:mannosidase alpha-like ER degradation enhancer 2